MEGCDTCLIDASKSDSFLRPVRMIGEVRGQNCTIPSQAKINQSINQSMAFSHNYHIPTKDR